MCRSSSRSSSWMTELLKLSLMVHPATLQRKLVTLDDGRNLDLSRAWPFSFAPSSPPQTGTASKHYRRRTDLLVDLHLPFTLEQESKVLERHQPRQCLSTDQEGGQPPVMGREPWPRHSRTGNFKPRCSTFKGILQET